MKRVTAILTAVFLVATLAACGEREPQRTVVERGKECFDAGGEWVWNAWSGYLCEFRR